jgi:hypothetical protein
MSNTLSDAAFASAAEIAQSLLAHWAADQGPGGAVVLFDATGPRREAYAGSASIANGLPLGPGSALRYASLPRRVMPRPQQGVAEPQ